MFICTIPNSPTFYTDCAFSKNHLIALKVALGHQHVGLPYMYRTEHTHVQGYTHIPELNSTTQGVFVQI